MRRASACRGAARRAAGGDRCAGLGERNVRGAGGGERWGEDAARGEMRMKGMCKKGRAGRLALFLCELCGGGIEAAKVTRVSLSDWLAFQARIRGAKDPRLLRDRPTDGAARAAEIMRGLW